MVWPRPREEFFLILFPAGCVLEVLEADILWPRWVARIGVTRSTQAVCLVRFFYGLASLCLCVARACHRHLSRVHPYRVGVQSEQPGCSSPTYLPRVGTACKQMQRLSTVLHTAVAWQSANELACGERALPSLHTELPRSVETTPVRAPNRRRRPSRLNRQSLCNSQPALPQASC